MLEGSCLCGAIYYQVDGFILQCHACHCGRCKKYSGSDHSSVMIGLARNLTWQRGAGELTNFEAETPNPRAFCRNCGSPMPSVNSNGMTVVPAGTLDTDPGIPLRFHIYTKYKPSWEPKVSEPGYLENMPPEAAIPIWHDIGSRLDELGDDAIEFMRVCDRTEGFREWWSANMAQFDTRLQEAMRLAQARNDTDG